MIAGNEDELDFYSMINHNCTSDSFPSIERFWHKNWWLPNLHTPNFYNHLYVSTLFLLWIMITFGESEWTMFCILFHNYGQITKFERLNATSILPRKVRKLFNSSGEFSEIVISELLCTILILKFSVLLYCKKRENFRPGQNTKKKTTR